MDRAVAGRDARKGMSLKEAIMLIVFLYLFWYVPVMGAMRLWRWWRRRHARRRVIAMMSEADLEMRAFWQSIEDLRDTIERERRR